LLAAVLAVMPEPAYAYIDPGLGSLLFQGVVAGFLAVSAAWVGFKMKVANFFGGRKDKEGAKPKK
jgi:hypothetical protein